jgi:uracil-DNA glycosylase
MLPAAGDAYNRTLSARAGFFMEQFNAATNADLRRAAAQRLESLERAGVTSLPKPRGKTAAPLTTHHSPLTKIPPTELLEASAEPLIAPPTERPVLLDIIRNEVAGCTRCSELATSRTQTVFGVGDPNARLMFVGEAPGADEDRRGEPFVGRAGQLLTRIIEACKLRRDDVYIANVLKCRPPDNRTPLPDEVLNCRGYLERQIAVIRPEMICCLGAVAAQTVLNSTVSIGRLRGTFHDYQGIPVVCTYHPSYLLRNPDAKRFVWDDMKMLMKRMGVEL